MIFITINTVCEFLCFLAAVIFLSNDKDPAWKLFKAYLLITCLAEFTGIYFSNILHISNYAVYNVFFLFECGMVSFFFYHLYKPYKQNIKWLIAWYVIFLTMYGTELIMNHFKGFVSNTLSVVSVVFVFTSLYYFYLKLKDEQFERLVTSASFWWVSGALFFYFGGTTCNIFFDYLTKTQLIVYGRSIRYLIFILLDVILYSFWSYAFLCRYLQRKSSS